MLCELFWLTPKSPIMLSLIQCFLKECKVELIYQLFWGLNIAWGKAAI